MGRDLVTAGASLQKDAVGKQSAMLSGPGEVLILIRKRIGEQLFLLFHANGGRNVCS